MLRPYGNRPIAVRDLRRETRLLALVAAILVVFGLTAVYGASSLLTISGGQVGSSFALKQALGAAVGGIVAALLARSDYRKWQRAAWPVLGVVAVLLLLPLLPFTQAIAPSINGARRWVNLGFVTVQPSELAKFGVVVWTAMLAAKKGERIRTFQYGLLPFLVVLVPLVALIFLEPNLSMAVLVTLLAGVVLFGTFAWLGFRMAESAGDPFGRLLAVGLTGMIGITAVLHIGVTRARLPATGITLPFISYGRSSLFVALVATGVLISVRRGRRSVGA